MIYYSLIILLGWPVNSWSQSTSQKPSPDVETIWKNAQKNAANREREQKQKEAAWLKRCGLGMKSKENEKDHCIECHKRAETFSDLKVSEADSINSKIRSTAFQLYQPRPFMAPEDLANMQVKSEIYTVWKLSDKPIYYFLFKNSLDSSLMFNRLAVYAEKTHNRVVTDSELQNYVSEKYNGDDYSLKDVADFFSQAKSNNIQLNVMEERLKDELLNAKLIDLKNGQYNALSTAAIVGSTDQYDFRRDRLLSGQAKMRALDPSYRAAKITDKDLQTPDSAADGEFLATVSHELNHGIYFTDSAYSKAVGNLWESLAPETKREIIDTLEGHDGGCDKGYDSSLPDVIIREFAAYFRDPLELKHIGWVPKDGFSHETQGAIERLRALEQNPPSVVNSGASITK